MEKENVILNDDELKEISGGVIPPIPPTNRDKCNDFKTHAKCIQYNGCKWENNKCTKA